ncbi:hypothetical protein G6O67_004172 [Ophiocordyceps sinensis]|uniref:HTH OST-type domain-containing protein n=2 Tax=Ophiocordyceps sinensis TaxID=72228 RepID=A0A8H4PNU7_9HYPO|nr:hypothetical protein OCS_05989 [Ophiocordyceps sinensis CO18]KAF4507701.1 hypothetical protein G6O67_004172 [Ophiocordyceps sinensis]
MATTKLAVLIDTDNGQPITAAILLAEITKYGTALVKRAYGDWTDSGLRGWRTPLLRHSVELVQQFTYTQGKNATDSAMIIDAMDLLYSNCLDAFCLVSNDSNYTRLASRIRSSGLVVYGFGERNTPERFVMACNKFIFVEDLVSGDKRAVRLDQDPSGSVSADIGLAVGWLSGAIEAISDDEGWAGLAAVDSLLLERHPEFDPRNYGFAKLGDLLTANSSFEVIRRSPLEGKAPVVYVRDKGRT